MPIVILSKRQSKRIRPGSKKKTAIKSKGGQMSRGRNKARKTTTKKKGY